MSDESKAALVHLDHAGASRPGPDVIQAVTEHLRLEADVGGYRAQTMVAHRLAKVRADAARLVGVETDEVALVENATRGWGLAVHAAAATWAAGDRVLVSRAEFGSCRLALASCAEARGVQVEVIPDDDDGQLSVTALRDLLDERVRMVALTHVASHCGTVHPVAEAASVAGAAGALVVVDAAQSLGQLPVDMQSIDADVLVGTSRKFLRGPRGAGVLVVRRDALAHRPPPHPELLHVHANGWRRDAVRFETSETSVAVRLGLGVAVQHVLSAGIDHICEQLQRRRTALRDALTDVAGMELVDPGAEHAATVAFRIAGRPAEQVRDDLEHRGVIVAVARPVHTPEGFDRPESLLRASVHEDSTDDDLDRLIEALMSR